MDFNKVGKDIVLTMAKYPDRCWTLDQINKETLQVWGIAVLIPNITLLCQKEIIEKMGYQYQLNGRSSAILQTLNQIKNEKNRSNNEYNINNQS